MSSQPKSTAPRKRPDPPGNDAADLSEEEFGDTVPTDEKTRYRSRVLKGNGRTQFPQEPQYRVGETVYINASQNGQTRVTGPFIVTEILTGNRYKLKRRDNDQEHPHLVNEDQLLVRTNP